MTEPYLRRADIKDMDLLFQWANDETTRQNAFNTKKISYEEHVNWFINKMESNNCVIYIYCMDDKPIGQVRVDIENSRGLISFNIDANHRSRGHGKRAIELLESIIKNESSNMKILVAQVKKSNLASQRIFKRLNYRTTEKEDFYEYEKENVIYTG